MASRTIHFNHVVDFTLKVLGCLIVAAFVAWMILNWLAGCGERFPTVDGGYIDGVCILHPHQTDKESLV